MKRVYHIIFLLLAIQSSVLAQSLKELADAKSKFIGTAVNNNYLEGKHSSNPVGYASALANEFNCVVAENAFKMGYLLPNKPSDPFDFTIDDFSIEGLNRIDSLLVLAETNNMRVRGHAYIWYNQAPAWLKADAPNWTDEEVYDFAEAYITALGTYTKGKVDEWDVVNEAINDNGTPGYRTADTWYAGVDSIQGFIDHCFNVAATVDPDALNFYNDYSIETKYNQKNTFMLDMVEGMKDRGVAIHAVGMQSHFISGSSTTTNFINEIGITIDKLDDLGLEAAITELDLRICGGTSQLDLEEQGQEIKEITQMFLSKDNCQSLLVWGVSDKVSWIPSFFSGCDDALLFDDFMNTKPVYDSLIVALGGEVVVVEPGELSPFGGTATSLPGTLEVENYDLGGNGLAYQDNTAGNEGGEYRNDSVDIAGTGDQGGGKVLGWNEAGEWLKYTVNVTQSGTYQLTYRVATPVGGGDFDIYVDDKLVVDGQKIAKTGDGWDDFIDVVGESIALDEGEHVIQLVFNTGGFNFNYIKFAINDVVSGLNGETESDYSVFPNPVQQQLSISLVDAELVTLQVISLTGVVQQVTVNQNQIDVSSLTKGIYILRIQSKKGISHTRFVKE